MLTLTPAVVWRCILYVGIGCFVGAIALRIRSAPSAEPCDAACHAVGQATKHAREDRDTTRAVAVAAEKSYAPKRESAKQAVAAIASAPTPRDSIAALVTAVAKQDTALVAADSVVATHKEERAADDRLARQLEIERDMWKARANLRPPRFGASVSGLYDLLAQIPAASVDAEFRLLGNVSVIARAEQRFAPGAKPRLYVGGKVRL